MAEKGVTVEARAPVVRFGENPEGAGPCFPETGAKGRPGRLRGRRVRNTESGVGRIAVRRRIEHLPRRRDAGRSGADRDARPPGRGTHPAIQLSTGSLGQRPAGKTSRKPVR